MNPSVTTTTSLGDYTPLAKRFDEAKTAAGTVRSHFQPLDVHLRELGSLGLADRSSTIEQLVRENGTTFHANDKQGLANRPWKLSAIPLIIDSQSWAKLESGLIQRTRVLEAVLADLLGPQRLVSEGIVPADILWANPLFQRAYHQLPSGPDATGSQSAKSPFGNGSRHRLHITATDVARGNDGSWWVIGDRTRAPSGLGYMLENRIVTSRVFPQLIRSCNTRRLASFFESLRDHLRSLAPRLRDNPRVALLTPGGRSYREFEDAYLARYLGLTLVQGTDLAVRGGRLNLKTLGGLLPIEVLWRHISDRNCDPLELEPGSTEGATGMMQTIRDGNLAVANSIGSVMAQVPALLPFLASASQFLFQETLSLPSVATYWCGGKRECGYVFENLDKLVIRPAFAVTGVPPVVPAELSESAREELVQAMRANPQNFIAQEQVTHSTTPVWQEGRLQSWHVALRCFQLQTSEGVEVVPGAMARLSAKEHELSRSPVSGQVTQDCWIVSNKPVDIETTLLPPADARIGLRRGGDELPSRVAEHLFWLGRYCERAEAITRLLRTTLIRVTGEDEMSELSELPRLVAALAALGQIEPGYAVTPMVGAMPQLEESLPLSVLDLSQPRGLQKTMQSVTANARALRDRLSTDAYRIIQRAATDLNEPQEDHNVGLLIERLNHLVADLLAFAGIASESVVRTHAWRFLLLGRRIERAYQTAELLSATLVPNVLDERPLLEAVLETTDSLMTYRSRYLNLVRTAATIDLLVTDETNPRSLRFQLQEIVGLLNDLPTDSRRVGLGQDEIIAESLLHELRKADPHMLNERDDQDRRERLETLMRRIIEGLPLLSDAIAGRYLIHTGATRILTGILPATP
ncbi:MAG: circularly permuted type 2 ATP-grasp protein [Pirellulaceae bacterium]|nr:circularly permuted type 2 ATP-grasp protein [Pirellulaceae bacterium]